MRHFCGWQGASPVNRDPGLAALKIQLPRSMRACLFGVGRRRPGAWAVAAVSAHCAFRALWTLGKSSCIPGLTLIITETGIWTKRVFPTLSWGPEGLWEVPWAEWAELWVSSPQTQKESFLPLVLFGKKILLVKIK